MTARTRACWWLAVTGCLIFLAAIAGAATIQPGTPKRTVQLHWTTADSLPRTAP